MKKFEFTGETKTLLDGTVLHRIKALVHIKFGCMAVEIGELGGWIEKENNLSHDGNAWVCGNAEVYGNAWVCGNARVYEDAKVYGNAWVCGNAEVYGNARVCDDARVYGNARVYDEARVCRNAEVYGNARVCGDAEVFRMEHYLVIGPIGSRNAFTTFFRTKERNIKVVCGCFFGTIDEFLAKVEQTHGDSKHAKVYRAAVEVALAQLEDVERRNGNG